MVYLNFLLQLGQLVQCRDCSTVRAGYLTSGTEVSREEAVAVGVGDINELVGKAKKGAGGKVTGDDDDEEEDGADMFGDFTGLGTIITVGETLGILSGTSSSGSSITGSELTWLDLCRKQRISELDDSHRFDTNSAESIHLLPLSWIKKVSTRTTAVA